MRAIFISMEAGGWREALRGFRLASSRQAGTSSECFDPSLFEYFWIFIFENVRVPSRRRYSFFNLENVRLSFKNNSVHAIVVSMEAGAELFRVGR